MPKLVAQVDKIVAEAASRAEELIKVAVRKRMSQRPYPACFCFAMGGASWYRKVRDGRVEADDVSHTKDIDDACDAYLDAFGTMTWRVDRGADGRLVESTMW